MRMFVGYSPASPAWLKVRIGRPRIVFSLLITTSARSGAMRFCWVSTGANRRRCGLEPGSRRWVEERREACPRARVVGVEPLALLGGQQIRLDERPVDRRQRQGLEGVERLFGAGDRGCLDHQHEALDADAVLVGLVVAGLVG